MKVKQQQQAIVFFDGLCNLCNGFVLFIIKRDSRGYFKFGALQSVSVQLKYPEIFTPGETMQSVFLLENNKVYTRSTAALRIIKQLDGMVKILYIFQIVPSFIRDPIYTLLAKNRYAIFGKHETCMVPSEELKARFVE